MKVILSMMFNIILAGLIFLQVPNSDSTNSIHYTRMYSDSLGVTHFSDEKMAMDLVNPGHGIQPTPASQLISTKGLLFFCPPAKSFVDWHKSPGIQYNLILSGKFEVEVSDGEKRIFVPGDILLVEDIIGKGHRTKILGNDSACFAVIILLNK